MKRIVAVAGDHVETHAGRLFVDGHAVAEPYVLAATATGIVEPQIIPRDSFFVLGDNRVDSFDSRHWGPLPNDRIVGRARMVLWSSVAATHMRLFRLIR